MEDPEIPVDQELDAEAWQVRVRECFQHLRRQGAAILVETRDGSRAEAHIESVDEAKGRLVLSLSRMSEAGLGAGDEVRLLFVLRGAQWAGETRVHYPNEPRNRFTLIMPSRLEPSDRRREPRVVLDTTDNVKASFRPATAPHLLVTGRLSNLSESGFRMAVESALEAASGRHVDPADLQLAEQDWMDDLRLTGLRESPLEAGGLVLEVDPQPLGPILGVRFRALPVAEQAFLKDFVGERSRRSPEAARPAPAPTSAPAAGPSVPPGAESPLTEREDLRAKRFRTLGLVMPPGPDRDEVQAFLAQRGFTRVRPAGTLFELATLVRRTPPDAFLVDWPEAGPGPGSSELDIVDFLGHHPFPTPPRMVLACFHATTQLAREANRLGVSHLLVKPYALDDVLEAVLVRELEGEA